MAEQTFTLRGRTVRTLDPNEYLKTGDRIFIRFNWIGDGTYSKATQWALIEKAIENRPDFRVLSYVNENVYLEVFIEILKDKIYTDVEQPGQQLPDIWSDPGVYTAALGPGVAVKLIEVTGYMISAAFLGACGYLILRSMYKDIKEGAALVVTSPGGQAALLGIGLLAGLTLIKMLTE